MYCEKCICTLNYAYANNVCYRQMVDGGNARFSRSCMLLCSFHCLCVCGRGNFILKSSWGNEFFRFSQAFNSLFFRLNWQSSVQFDRVFPRYSADTGHIHGHFIDKFQFFHINFHVIWVKCSVDFWSLYSTHNLIWFCLRIKLNVNMEVYSAKS